MFINIISKKRKKSSVNRVDNSNKCNKLFIPFLEGISLDISITYITMQLNNSDILEIVPPELKWSIRPGYVKSVRETIPFLIYWKCISNTVV
jgi:hypothetical protein